MSVLLRLTFMSGPRDGETIAVASKGAPPAVAIGRVASDGGIALPSDPDASRLHARLTWRDGGWSLEDVGSRNGTFVGEFTTAARLTAPTTLHVGQIFRVGLTRFRLEGEEPQPARAAISTIAQGNRA